MAVGAGLEDHAARALVNLGSITAEMRYYEHARQDLDRAVAFTQANDLAAYARHVLGYRARVRLDQGTGLARSRTLTRCWPSGCGRAVGWRRRWRRW